MAIVEVPVDTAGGLAAATGSAAPLPEEETWSTDPQERVLQLTRQLKVARDQLDRKSDACDELADQLRKLEAMPLEGNWSADPAEKEAQLTRQLKVTREQLDRKSDLCDELAVQLRRLETDLEERDGALRSARACLSASCAELRAAAHAGEARCLEREEEAVALRERLQLAEVAHSRGEAATELHAADAAHLRRLLADEEASAQTLASRAAEDAARVVALDGAAAEVRSLREQLDQCRAELEAARRAASAGHRAEVAHLEEALAEEKNARRSAMQAHAELMKRFEEHTKEAAGRIATAEASATKLGREAEGLRRSVQEGKEREAGLRKALNQEKELHEEALHMLHSQRIESTHQSSHLQSELDQLSSDLEQKEDEIMNIEFEMVGLQNKLKDQMRLFSENNEELKRGREQLAEKDGRLQHAVRRQEELVQQMNEATTKLQEKVAQLSHELEGSRAAYQTLEQHTQAVISRHETEREKLILELAHARSESASAADAQAANDRLEAERQAFMSELAEARTEVDGLEALRGAAQQEARLELDGVRAELRQAADAIELQRQLTAKHEELQHGLREEHAEAVDRLAERDASLAGMAEVVAELRGVAERCGAQASTHEAAASSAEARQAETARQLQDSSAQLEQLREKLEFQQRREAALAEGARREAERGWELRERLRTADERTEALELRARDLERALERSRLLERQALERAQELRTSLALLREFGREDFMHGAVPKLSEEKEEKGCTEGDKEIGAAKVAPLVKDPVDEQLGAEVPSVLISVELDLGFTIATLSVAPWQTRADFDSIVSAFLKEHRVRAVFSDALVRYLEEVEAQAKAFPVILQANLAEVYSLHG